MMNREQWKQQHKARVARRKDRALMARLNRQIAPIKDAGLHALYTGGYLARWNGTWQYTQKGMELINQYASEAERQKAREVIEWLNRKEGKK